MSLFVERIPNKPIDSNCFVVYSKEDLNCLIIDPGTEDPVEIIDFIESKRIYPQYIFLTHEHFDHIWGVNGLKDHYNSQIVCSRDCSSKIIDKKKNMSIFFNQVGFETYHSDIIIEYIDNQIVWNDTRIEFISTQGHTDASVCILIKNHLFTGDTIIKDLKTVTKLPGGSKTKLKISLAHLDKKLAGKQIIVHPGHGESFAYDDIQTMNLI